MPNEFKVLSSKFKVQRIKIKGWNFFSFGFYLLAFTFYLLTGCKEPTPSVLDIISDSGTLTFVDTSTIVSFTLPDDSIRTDETSLNLLGIYNDPVFGISSASIYTQIQLSSIKDSGFGNSSDLVIDSVILSLKYNSIYGKKTAQSLKIFELSEDIYLDSNYFSTKTFQYEAAEIGDANNVIPNNSDSVNVGGTNEPPQLRIALNNSVGDKLIKSSDLSVYQSENNFIKYFKGLFLMPDSTSIPASGDGAILYFDLLSVYSKLSVYYRNIADTDTFKFDFAINGSCARTSNFKFNRTGTSVFSGDTINGNNLIYIQSMSGAKTKIKLPFLEKYTEKGKVAVNKAEMIFPVEDNSTIDFSPHSNLYLTQIDSTGNAEFLLDFFEGATHYGGEYDASKQQYVFNITRHIQFLLTKFSQGENFNYGMYLMGGGKAVNANRTILKGNKNPNGVEFKISYTPL